MNKVVNLRRKSEEQLQLGQCAVLPGENLVIHEEQSIRLEPKVMRVLMVLGENAGEAVSRQQLIEQAWDGRPVTDDAITRCISILRRLFEKDLQVPIFIETVSKVGYRLKLEDARPGLKTGHKLKFAFGVVLAVAVVFILNQQAGPVQSYQVEKLLVSDRAERQPVFSPDGKLLAYTVAAGAGQRHLYIRELGGDGLSQVTEEQAIDHQPVFSPDGGRIAFARFDRDRGCRILSISSVGGRTTRHGECADGGVNDLEWTPDGKSLIFVERQRGAHFGSMSIIDIESGKQEAFMPGEERVDDMALSPDGRSIAITRYQDLGVEDLYWRRLDGDEDFVRLTNDNVKIHGLAWSHDSEGLFFTSNRLGPFQLWFKSIQGGVQRQVPEALHGGDALAVSGSGVVALESWHQRSEILSVSLEGISSVTQLVPDKGVNWDPRFSSDGKLLAYVSDRTGAAEIWIRDSDDEYRLTDFRGPWVLSPRWSPVNNALAYVVPNESHYRLQLHDVETRNVVQPTNIPNAFAPAWSPDGSYVVLGMKANEEWGIYKFQIEEQTLSQLVKDGKRAMVGPGSEYLYYSKADSPGIWRKALGVDTEESLVTDRLAPVDWNNWQLKDSFLYYLVREEEGLTRLWRLDIETMQEEPVASLPDIIYFSGIGVSNDHSEVFYSRITEEDADISLLTPR